MTTLIRKNMHPFVVLFMVAALFSSCEDYEEEIFEMSDVELNACALLNDTLEISVDTYDMAHLSPDWSGFDIESAITSDERIGSSWFDDDHLILNDIYVFIVGTDTLAALQFKSLVYEESSNTVDSVEFEILYNAGGGPSFSGAIKDTLLVTGLGSSSSYVNFETGLTVETGTWHLEFDGATIKQNSTLKLNRVRGQALSTFSTAPNGRYFADGPGYAMAFDQLMADSLYLEFPDSLNYLDLSNSIDAGFILWDRTGQLKQNVDI